jgi:hypothetical protein
MRARTSPWLAVVTILTGGAFAVIGTTAGCGSKADDGNVTPADTGIGFVDAKDTGVSMPDTTTAAMDTEPQYDVPGSLFDASLPDITFEGGKTLGGCYDCTTDKCKMQVEACDTEPRCRGLVLCILTKCGGSTSDFGCLLGCGSDFGVTGLDDPIASKGFAVGTCVQNNCKDACPIPTDGGMGGTDAKTDAPADAAPADAATDASAFMIFPNASGGKAQSIDPAFAEKLRELGNALGAITPEARDGLVTKFSH